MKSKVYFTKEISKEAILKMYKILNKELKGNIAIKVHSGEAGNQNYIKPEMYQDIISHLNATVVECNTAYEGERNETEKHKRLLDKHNWTKYFKTDILDENGDLELTIPNGKIIKKNYVGKNMENYDSMLVISHFKGHPMGGFGGSLKNISIGLASSYGKAYIHGAGTPEKLWSTEQDLFIESMADAASSVKEYYKDNILFINIMCNMSVDCDCCAKAEDPCMKDIGILSSTDPVALDKACVDLVYNSEDSGKDHLIERIESRNGLLIIESANELGFGKKDYELINID